MNLEQILTCVDIEARTNFSNVNIEQICYSSRECGPNSLFVAIKGYRTDGHDYIADAIQKGAIAIVHSSELSDYQDNIVYIKTPHSREMLPILASNFYRHPSDYLTTFVATGTNGKTTSCSIARHIFSTFGKKTALSTGVGFFIGDETVKVDRTTPESLDLQRFLRQAVDIGSEYFFMEASSHGIYLSRVAQTRFDCAAFSNLTHDHLDFHKTMENYYQVKKSLFLTDPPYTIINIDDPYGERLAGELKERGKSKILTYSFHKNSDYVLSDFQQGNWQQSFRFCGPNIDTVFHLPMGGLYNAYNASAGIIYALQKNIPLSVIFTAIETYTPAFGRMNRIHHNGYDILIDYAHTPDGLLKFLTGVKGNTKNRLISVFGCDGNRDVNKRPMMGKIAYDISDIAILTHCHPRNEDNIDVLNQVRTGFPDEDHVHVFADRVDAIKFALSLAQPGDSVALAGLGHYRYVERNGQFLPYNDEDTVRQLLNLPKA